MVSHVVRKCLTIAGLDSGGGAGIIADIKTFAALGVWGMATITSVTAQNTRGVFGIQDIHPDIIKKQIRVVVEDIGVDAAKTGMLHTREIINTVVEEVSNWDFPIVVDPIMVAKSGDPLMRDDARDALIRRLIPLAKVVTPNIPEAEVITGFKIRDLEGMKRAAKSIVENLGCEAVVIKGGHLEHKKTFDVLYHAGEFYVFERERISTRNTHGTGCTYSAAITAELAKGAKIRDAVETAKNFTHLSIMYGYAIGGGHGPVNHMAWLYRESERYSLIRELSLAIEEILSDCGYVDLIPEVGMNIALASNYAIDPQDIVAVPGRIRSGGNRILACGCPEFGVSRHLSSYILTARRYDRSIRAAVNIRYDDAILERLKGMGLKISSYDRSREPEEIKKVEGMTISWGTRVAIEKTGFVPDVIYHKGDYGKEPMIVILGRDINDLINILRMLKNKEKH